MANSSDDSELDKRIKDIDARLASPSDRATRVWTVLQTHDPDLTTWDVLCFCAEFMGMVAERYHWIIPIAKRFVRLVYSAHYYDEHRLDSDADRITRRLESLDSGGAPNAGPKSLFNLAGADASSLGIRRGDTSTETPLHISDSARDSGAKVSEADVGTSNSGNADKPA